MPVAGETGRHVLLYDVVSQSQRERTVYQVGDLLSSFYRAAFSCTDKMLSFVSASGFVLDALR